MSRKEWQERCTRGADTDYAILKAKAQNPQLLSTKSTDPDAADYDEANEIFASGIKLARIGDFDAASPQIATSYLLDGRSTTFTPRLQDAGDDEARNFILDGELLITLLHHDETTFSCDVLYIMLAVFLGSVQGHGQEMIAVAMVRIDKLVSYLEKHPEIEGPNSIVLGGCLTRKELLYQKSTLRMMLGDYKNAVKDLTMALNIDEFYTKAREARATTWAAQHLKTDVKIHKEFTRILGEHHVDNRGKEVAYAFLAMTTLGNSSLGTFRDAKSWHDKMITATKRRDEIYGKRRHDQLPPSVLTVQRKFRECGDLEIFDTLGVERMTLNEDSSKQKRACLSCGATSAAGGRELSKCTQCKSAFYCSRECQVKDWKEHKKLCKILKNGSECATTKAEETSSTVDKVEYTSKPDEPAQEVLDEWSSNFEGAKRLEIELGNQFQKFGNGFSSWWSDMSLNEKMRLLLDVTNETIPLSEPSREEVAAMLRAEVRHKSSALFDYNIESLCGLDESEGKLLEEMKEWAHNAEKKDEENIRISTALYREGVFPNIFAGKLARGELNDASAAYYDIGRKIHSLCLFAKLFDEYSMQIRRLPPINPMERLNGCNRCRRSCQGESSKQCQVCKVYWFCSQGCMLAASHVTCPYDGAQESKAIFQ